MTKYIVNEHSWGKAVVREDLAGKHREHCLCFAPCVHFKPNTPDNCVRAQELYEYCVKWDMVTPVWECPVFQEQKAHTHGG